MKVLLFQEAVDGRCTSSNYGHDTDTDATNWPIFAAQRGAFCHWPVSFVSMMGLFRYISVAKKKNDAANKSLGWPTGLIGTAQVFLYFYFFFLVLLCRSRRNNHWNAQMERRETQLTGWQVVNCFGGVALSSSLAPHFVASSPCSKERTSHGSEVIRTRKATAARSLPARMKVNEEERCPICC